MVIHHLVLAPTCTDGVKDQNETDTDCGGSQCPKCADGKTCQSDSDCDSGVCKSMICQSRNHQRY